MRIRGKLILSFLSLCLIPLIGVAVITNVNASNAILQENLDHLGSVAKIQKARTTSIINHNLQRLALLSSRTQLLFDLNTYLVNKSNVIQEKMNSNLRDALSSIINFEEISIMNLDGEVVASTNAAMIGTVHADDEVFLRGRVENIADVLFLDEQNNLRVYVAGPLYLDGKPIGVIKARAFANDIVSIVQDYSGLGDTGETLLARRNDAGDALFITPIRFDPEAALNRTVSQDALDVPITQALLGNEGLLANSIDYRGEPVFAATQYIKETDWGLVTKIDKAEVLAPITDLRNLLVLITVLISIIIVFVSIYLARSISRPIVSLARTAADISSGDLSRRAEVTSRDEIGDLAQAFNQMAVNLVEANIGLERQVAERTNALEDKAKELEQIVYVTSHDLRSPLVNIQGFTRELEESLKDVHLALESKDVPSATKDKLAVALDKDIPGSLKFITTSTAKIDALLTGLLQLSRLGRATLTMEDLDMNKLMLDVIQVSQFRAKEAGATIEVADLPPCRGDKVQINQVFSNLVENALKFLDSSRQGIIKVSGNQDGERVIYCVEDNGIGIPAEYQENIFEIFNRLDPTGSSGEGLGLTIIRRIINRHGGKVSIESEPGQGSKFSVSLPAIK